MEILEIIQTDDLLPHEVKWWEKYQPFTFNGHPDRSPQFKDNPSWLSSVLDDGNVLLWALGSVASILTMWDLVGGIRVTIILGFVVTLCRHYLKHRQLYGNKIVITPIVEETAPVIEPVAVEEVVDPITINAQRLIEEYGVTCLVGKGMGGPTKGEMSQFLFGQPNTGPNPAKLGRILERVPSLLEENPKTSSG